MYYPFLRGKQFELVMLRELAPSLARWGFVPIIEPVRQDFPALKRALAALMDNNCHFILISNPTVGALQGGSDALWNEVFDDMLADYRNYHVGLCLTARHSIEDVQTYFAHRQKPTSIIHWGFSDGGQLAAEVEANQANVISHVFVGMLDARLYRKHFRGVDRVLVEDGFEAQRNADYPPEERFSDLYLTYDDMGEAFGDFLMVGQDYKEGGGPAHAVAIHLTYVEPNADNELHIKHYVSDRNNSPADPAGKFFEALGKLVADVESRASPIFRSSAVEEYLELYETQHFPGLGYIKKLSMQHHIELMAHLLGRE